MTRLGSAPLGWWAAVEDGWWPMAGDADELLEDLYRFMSKEDFKEDL